MASINISKFVTIILRGLIWNDEHHRRSYELNWFTDDFAGVRGDKKKKSGMVEVLNGLSKCLMNQERFSKRGKEEGRGG